MILARLSHPSGTLARTTGLTLSFPPSHPLADWCRHVLMGKAKKQNMSINAQTALKTVCIIFGLIGPEKSCGKAGNQSGKELQSSRAESMDTAGPLTGCMNITSVLQELNRI